MDVYQPTSWGRSSRVDLRSLDHVCHRISVGSKGMESPDESRSTQVIAISAGQSISVLACTAMDRVHAKGGRKLRRETCCHWGVYPLDVGFLDEDLSSLEAELLDLGFRDVFASP